MSRARAGSTARRALARVAAAALCTFWAGASAQESAPRPHVVFARDPDVRVLRFSREPGEIEDADPGPSLEIFGDGRVHVHYPRYMRRAGEWEMRLPPERLARLLGSLAERGLLELDPGGLRVQMQRVDAERRARAGAAGQTAFLASDPATTRLELRAAEYAPPASSGPPRRDVQRRIEWRGLAEDARRYPELPGLRALAETERELLTLMEDPGLERGGP